MPNNLLRFLNGDNNGAFRKWLDDFNGEPRIAWYPSAGEDFRDLLYLNQRFSEKHPLSMTEPRCPDIYLHTDYSASSFLDNRTIHLDSRTLVYVQFIEELPRCELPLDDQIVNSSDGRCTTHRIFFLEIVVKSKQLGEYCVPVVYAVVENAAFCSMQILPHEGRISHIIHVRYGGGLGGGGKSTGIWLLNVLRQLHCEVFITDGNINRQSGDDRVYISYPNLAGNEDQSQLEKTRIIPSKSWSGHGDVSWNIVRKALSSNSGS